MFISTRQGDVDPTPIERGVRLLINSQMDDGDFPQQVILMKLDHEHGFKIGRSTMKRLHQKGF